MKVWITKYALTEGILEKEAKDEHDGCVSVREGGFTSYFHGKDWHIDRKMAALRAENMRTKRLIALAKKVDNLTQLKFE